MIVVLMPQGQLVACCACCCMIGSFVFLYLRKNSLLSAKLRRNANLTTN